MLEDFAMLHITAYCNRQRAEDFLPGIVASWLHSVHEFHSLLLQAASQLLC